MPFESKRQARYFFANREELESQGVDVDEWARKTDFSKIPERKGKKLPEKKKKEDEEKKAAEETVDRPFAAAVIAPYGRYFAGSSRPLDKTVAGKPTYHLYGFPGGKLDPGETPLQAVIREAEEEGWDVEDVDEEPIFKADTLPKYPHPVWWYAARKAKMREDFKEKGRVIQTLLTKRDIRRKKGVLDHEALAAFLERMKEKDAYENPLSTLLEAKARSDVRDYAAKQALMRRLMSERADEFEIDSEDNGIVGITHMPTNFRMHLPRKALTGFDIKTREKVALDISDYDKLYETFDGGHGPEHQQAVVDRAAGLADKYAPKQRRLVELAAKLHDIGLSKDRKTHEQHGADMVASDPRFAQALSKKDLRLLTNAIRQHRASTGKPRSLVAKIISDADRLASDSAETAVQRAINYRKKHFPEQTPEEMERESHLHLLEKYGPGGYGRRLYFPESEKEMDRIYAPVFDKARDIQAALKTAFCKEAAETPEETTSRGGYTRGGYTRGDIALTGLGIGALGVGAHLWPAARKAIRAGAAAKIFRTTRGVERADAAREVVRNYIGAANEAGKRKITRPFFLLDGILNRKAEHHREFTASPRRAMAKWLEEAGAWGGNQKLRGMGQEVVDRMYAGETLNSVLKHEHLRDLWPRLAAEKGGAPEFFSMFGKMSPVLMGAGATATATPLLRRLLGAKSEDS